MNRRVFLLSGFPTAVALATREAFAELSCTPFNHYGVQQCEAGIDSSVLDVSAKPQNASQWCWAACIEMVFRYYGLELSQEQIVRETWGEIMNLPGQPNQILANLNRRWTDEEGRAFRVFGNTFSANPITASQDLATNRPLIIGTLGHAMVLTSLTYLRDPYGRGQVTSATVRDPWPGRGRRILSPQEWYSTRFLARIRVTAL